jgi:hypothetical protein
MRLSQVVAVLLSGGRSALFYTFISSAVALTIYVANDPVCPIIHCDIVVRSHFRAFYNSIRIVDLAKAGVLIYLVFFLNYITSLVVNRQSWSVLTQVTLLAIFSLVFAAVSWSATLSFNPEFRSVEDGKVVSIFNVTYFVSSYSFLIMCSIHIVTGLLRPRSSKPKQ